MKAKELREKSAAELKDTVKELQKQLFDEQFKHGTRQLTDTALLSRTRKDIARALTVLRQKEIDEARAV